MNSRPMILRFCSGSVTPASAARNAGGGVDDLEVEPVAATKSFSTCSASPVRSSPWSTKTQVSWSPMARCTSAAATAESTPPDSPQMAWAEPTCARMRSVCSSMTPRMVQVGAAARRGQEPAQHGLAVLGVQDLGVVLDPVQPPAGVLGGGHRAAGGPRGHREAGRRDRAPVAVPHPHLLGGGQPVEQHAGRR